MATKSVQFTEFSAWRKAAIEAGAEIIPIKDTAKSTRYEARNEREEVIGTYAFSEGMLSAEGPSVGPKVPKPKVVKPLTASANQSSLTKEDDLKKSLMTKPARFAEEAKAEDEDEDEDENNWEDDDYEDEDDDDDFDEDDYEDDESDDGEVDETDKSSVEATEEGTQPDAFPPSQEPEPMANGQGMSIDESTLTDTDHTQGNLALDAFMQKSDPEFATNKEAWGKAKEYALDPNNKFEKKWSVAAAAYNKMQGQPEKIKAGPEAGDDVQYAEENTQQFIEGIFSNPPHRKSLFHSLLSKYGGRVFGKNKKGWRGRGQYITQFTLPDHLKQEFHAAARAAGFKLGEHYEVHDGTQHSESEKEPVANNTQHAEDQQFDENSPHTKLKRMGWKALPPKGSAFKTQGPWGRDYTHEKYPGHSLWIAAGSDTIHHFIDGKPGKTLKTHELADHIKSIKKSSQHAEDQQNKDKEIDNVDEAPVTDVLPPVVAMPPNNPDMPPAFVDIQKMQAVLAGLARKNIVLPSTFNFQDPAAMDILLAALNSGIKAEDEAEAEFAAQSQPESAPPTEVPMAYSEQQIAAQYSEEVADEEEDAQFAERSTPDDDHAYQIEIMHPTTIHGAYDGISFDQYSKLSKADQSIARLARHSDAIHKNLMRKIKKGVYDPEKAAKLFGYYTKGISDHLHEHHGMEKANAATRRLAAKNLEADFREHAKDGHFDHYLEKKPKSSQHNEDFGGVQSWSKGKIYPYTIMTIEDEQGNRFNQAQHPSGWKGERHPWQGEGKSHTTAEQAVHDEIAKHRGSTQHAELPPEVRERIERLERENIQFQEERKAAINKAAREGALMAIKSAKIPPILRKKLEGHYSTVQFNEGAESPTYTAADVANLVAECLPPQMMIQFDEAREAEAPTASKKIGQDGQGNPIFNAPTSTQFFEGSDAPSGHVPGDVAEKIVSAGPLRTFGVTSSMPTMSQLVAAENQRVPNNVMRK